MKKELLSQYFHAHIYFDANSRESAAALQASMIADLPASVQVSRLVDRPIGPHPLPMFEADFARDEYPIVRAYLESHRRSHTVLIHQVSEDEVWDHTEGAEWLGEPLKLDIQFLRDFMDGKTPGVSGTIPFTRKS